MTRYELERFLAQAGAHSLADYLGVDARGDEALRALDDRIAWAARAYRDDEHGPEATFLMTHAGALRALLAEGENAWRSRQPRHDPFAIDQEDSAWEITPPYATPQVAPLRQQASGSGPGPDEAGGSPGLLEAHPPFAEGDDGPLESDLPPDPGAITGSHRIEDWSHIPEFDGDRAEDVLALFGPAPEPTPVPADALAREPDTEPQPSGRPHRYLVFGAALLLLLCLAAGLYLGLITIDHLYAAELEAPP